MKDTDKFIDKTETRTLGSSIEREVEAAFDALESSQDNPAPWGEETLELTDAMMPNLTHPADLSTIPLPFEDDGDEIIELTDVASVEERVEGNLGDDDEILDLTEIVQTDLPTKIAAPLDEDDDILELTDMVPAEDALEGDDDILELTDVVEPGQLESEAPEVIAASLDEDDDILELTDMVPVEDALEGDDDILELTEMVPMDDSTPEMAGVEPSTETAADSEEEEVIDLADILDEQESGDEGIESQGKILRLGDILGKRPETAIQPATEAELGPEYALDSRPDRTGANDSFSTLGIAMDEMEAEGLPSVSAREVEAAVERIILKKYGASIETLIAKAVEKAVAREIDSIKRTIMDEDDPAG